MPNGKQRLPWLIALVGVLALGGLAWALAGYEPQLRLEKKKLGPLAFTPKGDVLLTGTLMEDGLSFLTVSPVRFLHSADGSEAESPLETFAAPADEKPPIPRHIHRAEFSPDGKLLAILQDHHDFNRREEIELIVFTRDTRERILSVAIPYTLNAADKHNTIPHRLFSADSKWLQWVEYPFPGRSVKVWDLNNRKEGYTLPQVCYPVISPDCTLIATTQFNRTRGKEPFAVQLWDIRTGTLQKTLPLQGTSEGWRPWASFSPDGKLLAVNSRDNNGTQVVEVFDTTTGKRVFQQQAWSPHLLSDGKMLITVKNNDVQRWDTTNWKLLGKSEFKLGRHWENGSDISPEPVAVPGKPFVMVSNYYPTVQSPYLRWLAEKLKLNTIGTQEVTFIDGSTGHRQPIAIHHDSILSSNIFSPDGNQAAFGTIAGSMYLWEIPPRKSLVAVVWASVLGVIIVGLALLKNLRVQPAGS
jgi:WD40 repeat protein